MATSPERVVSIIDKANGGDNTEAAKLLKDFVDLPGSEKDKTRSLVATKTFPLSADYEVQRQVPWSTNCWLQPLVIVTPITAQQVAAALALCVFFNIQFSVRGGGHLHNPGSNSNNGGVVISLSEFKQVRLLDDKRTADIGVGLRWLDVYNALDTHGLAVAGGRMPTVGVPGLILGGGLSFQNGQYGLGAMGVVNYEVVLADSSIVNANAQENTDLSWALKGGGANFGIITKIEMTTVSNKIWCEARVYPPTAYDSLVTALMQYHENIETDDQATLIWHGNSDAILHVYVYCSPVENPDTFAPFYDIPFLQGPVEPGVRTISDLMNAIAHFVSPEPMLHEFRTMSSIPSSNIYTAVEQARLEQTAALSAAGVSDFVLTNVFQPMSSLAMKKSEDSPLGLKPLGQQWLLTMGDFKHSADEARVREAVKVVIDAAEDTARKEGLFLEYKYTNYAARDQDALTGYGEDNLARLRGVSGKYDSAGVFQQLQAGGWLISKIGKT
ncbi:FAD-binding oxidoreductase [Aspergillus undulatus]|uniref:FAD-binding oxidoreductase n=1 Tax=Aspergillus undulatus TaxID=1810928 RepID=UPI003CCDBE0F